MKTILVADDKANVRNLRTKIEKDSSNPQYIQTVFGVGYRISAS